MKRARLLICWALPAMLLCSTAHAEGGASLWHTPDQRAEAELRAGHAAAAAQLYTDPRRKAWAQLDDLRGIKHHPRLVHLARCECVAEHEGRIRRAIGNRAGCAGKGHHVDIDFQTGDLGQGDGNIRVKALRLAFGVRPGVGRCIQQRHIDRSLSCKACWCASQRRCTQPPTFKKQIHWRAFHFWRVWGEKLGVFAHQPLAAEQPFLWIPQVLQCHFTRFVSALYMPARTHQRAARHATGLGLVQAVL